MEHLRQTLMTKVDALLAQVSDSPDSSEGTFLQIEACIFSDRRRNGSTKPLRRLILDTIDIHDYIYKSQAAKAATPPSPPIQVPHGDRPQTQHCGLLTPTTSSPGGHRRSYDSACDQTHGSSGGDRSSSDDDNTNDKTYDLDETIIIHPRTTRKEVGGLRLGRGGCSSSTTSSPVSPAPNTVRQLETDERQFPKRRKLDRDGPARLEQSTVDKLIEGIWEQIHKPRTLALGRELGEMFNTVNKRLTDGIAGTPKRIDFEDASRCCQQITSGSRTNRALEVIVQAHWIDCHDARINSLRDDRPDLKMCEVKRTVLIEACKHFQWSEKELRNRMAIWKGYKEIKDAAGWAALVFAGPGIYRFCKYRMGFDQEALAKLQTIRTRAEVAADTLQPQWRELLSLVGAPTQLHWRGHAHDWVVSKKKDPVPLSFTYRTVDPTFTFKHITDSIIDEDKWGEQDPRRVTQGDTFTCEVCSGTQSTNAELNECECFPDLLGPGIRTFPPVQVFRTDTGKNNGLLACCAFERGQAIGEFVGLITKGLSGVDAMQGQAGSNEPYQIWQGRHGNFTRFINHSCQPNCQFQTFTWLGIQRILVIAKGVAAGKELTVDYSSRYWHGLDKECLCGEPRCRYRGRLR